MNKNKLFVYSTFLIIVFSCTKKNEKAETITASIFEHENTNSIKPSTLQNNPKTDTLKAKLSKEEYYVTQEKGTERAFSGKYWDHHEEGEYRCICCESPLFDSNSKFKSGSGWPSFFTPIANNNIEKINDKTHGMLRVEVVCNSCKAHLGHVFTDGPQPTGLRYCINSASLIFKKRTLEK